MPVVLVVPSGPVVTVAPLVPLDPIVSGAPVVPVVPKVPDVPEVPRLPVVPIVPDVLVAPVVADAPEMPEMPVMPAAPPTVEVPELLKGEALAEPEVAAEDGMPVVMVACEPRSPPPPPHAATDTQRMVPSVLCVRVHIDGSSGKQNSLMHLFLHDRSVRLERFDSHQAEDPTIDSAVSQF
ncbi:hypothetical protein [Noviherbaspirillum massiliense]|uniref:hypothetical protein n=1 Tax=Noviherbaspirillum massiliense TaxID=1465823 RepID=UPI0011DC820E|nr:hypothetical protein [Noviherbaspirillum massiliense]